MAAPPPWVRALPVIALVLSLPLPFFPYSWPLFLHITGAVLFLGNIAVSAGWMTWAVRRRDARVAAFASASVNMADAYFTNPGAILIFVNGLVLAYDYGGGWQGFNIPFISAGLTLFIATAIVFAVGVRRDQRKMERMSAKASESGGALPPEFDQTFRRWSILGLIATLLPFIALVLMVFKPG